MLRFVTRTLLAMCLVVLARCGNSEKAVPPQQASGPARVGQTRGGAVVLSRDELVAVVCNRSASVVTVVGLDPSAPAEKVVVSKKELDLGAGWEPWAAVIGADDDTAYVISRAKQVVGRIHSLHHEPYWGDEEVPVGSEPTAVVISPSGARLFVANWGDGTISVITTYDFVSRGIVNLNEALVRTGVLGAIAPRAGLAHPRALVITDNGDESDADETLYATEFFSQESTCHAQHSDAGSPPSDRCVCQQCQYPFDQITGYPECLMICNGHDPPSNHSTDADAGIADASQVDDAQKVEDAAAVSDAPGEGASTEADAGSEAAAPAVVPVAFDANWFDRNRQGFVYRIKLDNPPVVGDAIPIQPVLDTGFYDAPNSILPPDQRRPTGCFPNQLASAAIVGNRLLVTGTCASPAGPLGVGKAADGSNTNPANFKTVLHPLLLVIDTTQNVELPDERMVLTQRLDALYSQDQTPDDTNRRFPLIPTDIRPVPRPDGRLVSLLTAEGTDALFRIDHTAREIGAPGARFVDLHGSGEAGRLPIGLAISTRTQAPFALVLNDYTQNLSIVDVDKGSVVATEPLTESSTRARELRDSDENEGHKLFVTGLAGWSFKGQGWLSCEGCHPDGLSDGVTWYFARGPRRTISTAGTYDSSDSPRRRAMLWGGNIDEVHDIEVIVRTVAGGMGALLWDYPNSSPTTDLRILYDGTSPIPKGAKQDPKPASHLLTNLNGATSSLVQDHFCDSDADHCDATLLRDWNKIDSFIRTVRSPRAPKLIASNDPDQTSRGQAVFARARCAGCHGGPGFTLSRVFYTPGIENNGSLPYLKPASPGDLGIILGSLRTTTYAVPPAMAALNPPGRNGAASLRWTPANLVDDSYNSGTALNDQLNCALRDVGTFPSQSDGPNLIGVSAPDAPGVLEVRQDMKTLALGATGFNIPSLLGVAHGAPYLHAGNARTLEEVFSSAFEKHYRALGADVLDPKDIADLVAYLLTIDDFAVAPQFSNDLGFDPDLCGAAAAALH